MDLLRPVQPPETKPGPPLSGDASVQMFIVRRGRESTFRLLLREFSQDPAVRIIWDRRRYNRRQAQLPRQAQLTRQPQAPRRPQPMHQSRSAGPHHRDRRGEYQGWPATQYLVINVD